MLRKQNLKTQRQLQKTEIDEIRKIDRKNTKRNNYIRDHNSICFVKKNVARINAAMTFYLFDIVKTIEFIKIFVKYKKYENVFSN